MWFIFLSLIITGGLEHGGDEGGAVGDLVELPAAEVVDEDVEGEDVLEGGDGEVFVQEGGHGGIVHGQDGYGLAAVDLAGEVGHGEVVVEGGETGVLGQYAGDVVGAAGGGGSASGGGKKSYGYGYAYDCEEEE